MKNRKWVIELPDQFMPDDTGFSLGEVGLALKKAKKGLHFPVIKGAWQAILLGEAIQSKTGTLIFIEEENKK